MVMYLDKKITFLYDVDKEGLKIIEKFI